MSEDKASWLKAYGADDHFVSKTWESFEIDQRNRRTVEIVRSMQLGKAPGAFIYGIAGSGKTHLMKAIFNYLVDWKIQVAAQGSYSSLKPYWIAMSGYLDQLRNEQYAIKEKAKKATVLFIDDLGTSTKTDWVTDQVFQLIDHRAERELQTFASSNYKLGELEPIYGSRVVSRLFSLMIAVEMVGEDRRKRQMQQNFDNVIQKLNKGSDKTR